MLSGQRSNTSFFSSASLTSSILNSGNIVFGEVFLWRALGVHLQIKRGLKLQDRVSEPDVFETTLTLNPSVNVYYWQNTTSQHEL